MKFQIQYSKFQKNNKKSNPKYLKFGASNLGFTLIELMLVMALIAVLFGIASINLLQAQHNASLTTAEEQLIADLKSQQTKAMNGNGTDSSYGVHITTDGSSTYTLFTGPTYPGSDQFPETIDSSITFKLTSGGNDIIFAPATGETGSVQTIIVKNNAGGDSKTITLNKYGVITGD